MPDGLLKKFPKNSLQLMVQSGAKGSTVNAMQISCLLGQIELEGRRVPLMLNGSSLPSFKPYDTSPSAGGFVHGRFLTGIQPQEFFFHCMAGREGLVDTAVKTSRSGYLQRCLIKHLEGLIVAYDLTVRDSDGSVIQFLYGEDGLDISKMQMLKQGKLHLLVNNYEAVMHVKHMHDFVEHQESNFVSDNFHSAKDLISKWKKKHSNREADIRYSSFLRFEAKLISSQSRQEKKELIERWHSLDSRKKTKFQNAVKRCPDPVTSMYRPDIFLGAVSERLDSLIENYSVKCQSASSKKHAKNKSFLESEHLKNLMYYRAFNSLVHPGEAVGLLAAQSIGEPSTQMTLNTFHFAGRGEMNVTLGIPRLREILMVASANIGTPTMDLPLFNIHGAEEKANNLRVKLSSVYLKQVLESIEVEECVLLQRPLNRFRKYCIRLNILPYEAYRDIHCTNTLNILTYVEDVFIHRLIMCMKKKFSNFRDSKLVSYASKSQKNSSYEEDISPPNEDEGPSPSNDIASFEADSSDDGEGDGDTVSMRTRNRHNQDLEYEEPESEEKFRDSKTEADELVDEVTNSLQNEEWDEKTFVQCKYEEDSKDDEEKSTKLMKIQRVCEKYEWISQYSYKLNGSPFCQFTIQLPLKRNRLDLHTLVEEVASQSVLYSVSNIKRAFIVKNPSSEHNCSKMLKTDGVNFLEIFKYDHIIDLKKVYSNDIHAVARIYGIEAAAQVIVQEIKNVFATYGIEVDSRHLLLISDYMTFDGFYRPCNRIGMANNASPFQQMSFETTMNFLQSAALTGSEEQLRSPSSRIVVGKLVASGTGIFDLLL